MRLKLKRREWSKKEMLGRNKNLAISKLIHVFNKIQIVVVFCPKQFKGSIFLPVGKGLKKELPCKMPLCLA